MSKSPNSAMLLINKDSVVSFFAQNKTPDGITSFYSAFDTASYSYSFDMTKAEQMRLSGKSTISNSMVLVPISRVAVDTQGS